MSGHISRLEGRKARGWQVRIPTGQPRKYTSKMFSDKVLGGKAAARAAAEVHLADNAVESAAPHCNYLAGRGVFRTCSAQDDWYWGASFTHSPTQANFRPFRESVYGPALARRLATAYRRAWEKAVDAGELDRFFAEAYPAQARRERQYFQPPTGSVHLRRDALTAWCGRDLREWVEVSGPEDEVCRLCQKWLAKHLSLGNDLLHYHTIEPDELENFDDWPPDLPQNHPLSGRRPGTDSGRDGAPRG